MTTVIETLRLDSPKVRHVWEQQHWQLPHLERDSENSETHLVLRQESLLPEPVVEALVSRLRDGFTNQDELGRSILVTAEAEGRITHARARELTERHSRDVTLKLQELLRRGYLESDGKTRGTTYCPVSGLAIGHSSEESSRRSEQSSEQTRGWKPIVDQLEAVRLHCRDDWRPLPSIASAIGRCRRHQSAQPVECRFGSFRNQACEARRQRLSVMAHPTRFL